MKQGGEKYKNAEKISYTILLAGAIVLYSAVPLTLHLTKEEFTVAPYVPETYREITTEVEAQAAVIYNIDTKKVIAGKNIDEPKPIASITKLMSALLIYERLDETDETVLDASDFAATPNTPLILGDRWNTKQLLEYALITSSNRGIHGIVRTVEEKTGEQIVSLMNTFVRENSLTQTHFINPTGLDPNDTLAGSESSARNLAEIAGILVTKFRHLSLLTTKESEIFLSLDGRRYRAKNTNILLSQINENVLLSKTGYTTLAGGALIMVLERNGEKIAFVVLGSTKTKRFEDMQTLFALQANGPANKEQGNTIY